MEDVRDWGWLHRRDTGPSAPTPEREVWRVQRDQRSATAVVRAHPLGTELLVRVGDDLLTAQLFRPGEAEQLRAMSVGLLQTFQGHGWSLVEADQRPS